MMARGNDLVYMTEYIKNILYFATVKPDKQLKSTTETHYFCIDTELVYENYYGDFGPLNLGCVYRYCKLLSEKLKLYLNKQAIVHYASSDPKKAANAAFLMGCYGVLYLGLSPRDALKPLTMNGGVNYRPFQDATQGESAYTITILDCLRAIKKAHDLGFFNFKDFNFEEYDRLDRITGGDLNWIVPGKFLAFIGPVDYSVSLYHPPEMYIDYFLENDVKIVIRLNKRLYDGNIFNNVGIVHYDLFFADGSCPPRHILFKFLQISEDARCAIAVHCKAGLGRTGSLIGSYLIKHYRMSAREAIGWMRICRPGSVIGHQQGWLEQLEGWLIKQGNIFRKKYYNDMQRLPIHAYGVYSIAEKTTKKIPMIFEKAHNPPPPMQRNVRSEISPPPRPQASKFREETAVIQKGIAIKSSDDSVPLRTSSQTSGRIENNIVNGEHDRRPYVADTPLLRFKDCMWMLAVRCTNITPKRCQNTRLCFCLYGNNTEYTDENMNSTEFLRCSAHIFISRKLNPYENNDDFSETAFNKSPKEQERVVRTPKEGSSLKILNKGDQNTRSRSITRRGNGAGAGEPKTSNSPSNYSTRPSSPVKSNVKSRNSNSMKPNSNNNDINTRHTSIRASRPIPASPSPMRLLMPDNAARNYQPKLKEKNSIYKNERVTRLGQAITVTPHNAYRVSALPRDKTPSSFSTVADQGSDRPNPRRRLGRSPSPKPPPQIRITEQTRATNTPTASSINDSYRSLARDASRNSLKKALSRLKVVTTPRDGSIGGRSFGAGSLGAQRTAPTPPLMQRAPRVRSDERTIATQGDMLNCIKFQRRFRDNSAYDEKLNKNFHEKFSISKNVEVAHAHNSTVLNKWPGNSNTTKYYSHSPSREKPAQPRSGLYSSRPNVPKGRKIVQNAYH